MAEFSILNSQFSINLLSALPSTPRPPSTPRITRALTRVGVRKTGKQKTHSK